jgi:hypothetical protein
MLKVPQGLKQLVDSNQGVFIPGLQQIIEVSRPKLVPYDDLARAVIERTQTGKRLLH